MDYIKFVRKPFVVDAVEVTTENIEEIAKLVGELRYDTKRGNAPYIQVNRNVVPGVFRVFPGYWMTRMGDNIRCYNKRVFASQFCLNNDEIENWVNYIRDAGKVPDSSETSDVVVGDYGRIIEVTPEEEAAGEQEAPQSHIEVVVNGETKAAG